jgi:hypothetical protein
MFFKRLLSEHQKPAQPVKPRGWTLSQIPYENNIPQPLAAGEVVDFSNPHACFRRIYNDGAGLAYYAGWSGKVSGGVTKEALINSIEN